jgi:hypothetical protein
MEGGVLFDAYNRKREGGVLFDAYLLTVPKRRLKNSHLTLTKFQCFTEFAKFALAKLEKL